MRRLSGRITALTVRPGASAGVDLRRARATRPPLDHAIGAGRDDAPGDDVRFAEEVGGELRARPEIELLRRADLLDPRRAFMRQMRSDIVIASSWSCVT